MTDLRGKTALVTGGSKRIGREICLRLAAEGIHVAFSFRRSTGEAEATRHDIETRGVRALAVQADLTSREDCDALARAAGALAGSVDILVHNASEFPRTPLEDLERDPARFEETFRSLAGVHMQAPLWLGLRLGLEMKRRGWGRIVNILDRVVVRDQAYRGWSIYLATKYGLHGITLALAAELAPEVAVNGIAPGLVVPPPELPPEEVQSILGKIPLSRAVPAAEIAEDVVHLLRSEGKTGSVILSDGGGGLRAS